MGLFLIHPPQEYAKKSTQGSIVRSIEVTSSAGSRFAEGCCAVATETQQAIRDTKQLARTKVMDRPPIPGIKRTATPEYKARRGCWRFDSRQLRAGAFSPSASESIRPPCEWSTGCRRR